MFASDWVEKSENDEQCRPSKKSSLEHGWVSHGTKQHTFSVSQYARILSAWFRQNTGFHGKIRNFVIWKSMVNVKFTERRTANTFKRWISLKVAWLMHYHLLTQKRHIEPLKATLNWCYDAWCSAAPSGVWEPTLGEDHQSWCAVSDLQSLTVRQLTHNWCTDRSQTCLKRLDLSTEALGLVQNDV